MSKTVRGSRGVRRVQRAGNASVRCRVRRPTLSSMVSRARPAPAGTTVIGAESGTVKRRLPCAPGAPARVPVTEPGRQLMPVVS